MVTHSPSEGYPFSSVPLPPHYLSHALNKINKYEKQLISLPSLNDIEPVWHAPRNQTRGEVYSCPRMPCYPVLSPHFQGLQDLCTVSPQLSRCSHLLWLVGNRAGFLLSPVPPAKAPTPASHLVSAKAQAVAVSVLGGQKPLAAGWTTSVVYLGSIHQKRSISKRCICKELHSLCLKTDCSELYRDQSQEGTPPKCLSPELSTTQWTEPWYL